MIYFGTSSHPGCSEATGHVCHQPSGLRCVEPGCEQPAGTRWGPHWCPDHDAERLDRISASLVALARPRLTEETTG